MQQYRDKSVNDNSAKTSRPVILKDLCFLAGVICPILALILCFVVKDEVYAKAFKVSMVYGFVLWVVVGMIIGLNMCYSDIYGISSVKS